ncbi:MAG: EAL domain-containing protein, partial [Pseudomonadota bacterium]
ERSDGLAIISAVIALAHNLGLEVTAEGVERSFQVDALKTLGCDTLQGYFFGKPSANPMHIIQAASEGWDEQPEVPASGGEEETAQPASAAASAN